MKDDAVSPVIGVLLMVCITVILAAVIASFVFGMANTGLESKKVVGFTIKHMLADSILVTNMGGSDINTLTNVTIKVNDNEYDWIGGEKVGAQKSFPATVNSHIIVIGDFGGKKQVLQELYL